MDKDLSALQKQKKKRNDVSFFELLIKFQG